MSAHPAARLLEQLRSRDLAPAALQQVTRHVAGCAQCLEALPGVDSDAKRMVARVVAGGAHLSYEQMEACVDARADAALLERVQHHTAWCPVCSRELAELTAAAPTLRQPLASGQKKETSRSRWGAWAALNGWLTRAAAPLALAAIVAGTGVTLVLQQRADDSSAAQMRSVPVGTTPNRLVFDESSLSRLGQVSAAALAAYRNTDDRALANALRVPADGGNPTAAAALGVLCATGRGVTLDTALAEHYWQIASKAGEVSATHNLDVLASSRSTVGH